MFTEDGKEIGVEGKISVINTSDQALVELFFIVFQLPWMKWEEMDERSQYSEELIIFYNNDQLKKAIRYDLRNSNEPELSGVNYGVLILKREGHSIISCCAYKKVEGWYRLELSVTEVGEITKIDKIPLARPRYVVLDG